MKSIIIIIILGVITCGEACVGYFKIEQISGELNASQEKIIALQNKLEKTNNELEQARDEYRIELNNIGNSILANAAIAKELCNKYITAWHSAIFSNGDDDVQSALDQVYNEITPILIIVEAEDAMIQLVLDRTKVPLAGFERSREKLITLYGAYNGLYESAKSPTGTYDNYVKHVGDLFDEIQRCAVELQAEAPTKQ